MSDQAKEGQRVVDEMAEPSHTTRKWPQEGGRRGHLGWQQTREGRGERLYHWGAAKKSGEWGTHGAKRARLQQTQSGVVECVLQPSVSGYNAVYGVLF